MRWIVVAAVLAVSGAPHALAQPASALLSSASQAKDLEFPAEPSSLSFLSSPRMALYKPDGTGPFPALVLHHQCGGLVTGKSGNASMLEWTKQAVGRGYVVLLLDSLTSRGAKTLCMGPQAGVVPARGVRDALQGAEHLRRFAFVDKTRIGLVGFSWGAMVATLASSKRWAGSLTPGERFGAVVALYPPCFPLPAASGKPYEIVNADIDRPLLVLMGDKDTETPPSECVPKLTAAKSSGAPVDMHVYAGATHCWDCRHLDGFSKTDHRGNHVVYRYDSAITQDSVRRTFDFLDAHLKK